ncbi:glutamate racemase [Treponema bryantii]|uniref:Glutamate racemase n=1 Tax=Treponema bryantii TaxID=163 RepID=A0A1I3JIL8_9SPIR|nr:glutamate racemase [Treponema bryantii]SFI60113.1 glutamate racemase [Treponema bryantii]
MTDFVFIDSGVGGIPYMMKLLEKKPDASCVYVADTANFPYGEKTHEQVVKCVTDLVGKIISKFAPKVIVLACNTMSVNALDTLRTDFPSVNFVGTVPAIKLAASLSKKRRIGLLATKATCENPYNIELKNKFASDCVLVTRGDGQLVSYIEHNAFTASRAECLNAIKPAIDFFRQQDCDAVILGCTHFLNFTDVFNEACAPDIKVVDSVDGVVRHALEILQPSESTQEVSFPTLYITGNADSDEKKQYDTLCNKFNIKFSGII